MPAPHLSSLTDTLRLRSVVLGWSQLTVPLDDDSGAQHFVIRAAGTVVACGSSAPSPLPSPELAGLRSIRFYGVAVIPEFQNRGAGGAILTALIADATQQAAGLLWANARVSALPFYLARGFRTVGERFSDPLSRLVDARVVLDLPR